MFDKILIANRGEIAVRIMATCREMGIRTVAVYSDADRDALHVLEADQAVHLGPSEPSQSYLDMDRIVAAAKQTGAQAVHPGYGFLAENALFAERCAQEGLVFIGPSPHAIRDLGDKTVARRTMQGSGVPVIPGMMETEGDASKLAREADRIGFPVLIKASSGGGGKGMRVVRSPADLHDACAAASREAQAAFGNGAIYLEKYIEKPRHVEFQVLADAHGNVVHLLERECSIQRRHQKIIEETPSPALSPGTREAMGNAAIAAARASRYTNAGTVEFLLDEQGAFYFLEVNTRLQVEHPVTEMVTGIDLVRQQIEIASGMPLSITQADVAARGHAIECRIYAEDPLSGFLPSPGRISFAREPRGPGIRVDSGIYSGFTVPVEYDPILAKLIAHAGSRTACIERMVRALHDYVILGVLTPIPFLIDVVMSEAFGSGDTFTDFIDTRFAGWQPRTTDAELVGLAYVIDALAGRRPAGGAMHSDMEAGSPWKTLGNFRP
ncbi:MAG TPA: acetyl-CoA carboxylase biotin carboxylase subunit [Deltaproteobacteria bacterium]|nr:acetyl-CoA carboxylase biotin carboxylase subunit [Deltaproteobacteria bacterium]HQI80543.1 acetyl-CoA carboxylase biotin carboxylase subunit [Deltaproteobacteria bacterium]